MFVVNVPNKTWIPERIDGAFQRQMFLGECLSTTDG